VVGLAIYIPIRTAEAVGLAIYIPIRTAEAVGLAIYIPIRTAEAAEPKVKTLRVATTDK